MRYCNEGTEASKHLLDEGKGREGDKDTERDRDTERQGHRETGRQARQIETHTCRQTDMQVETEVVFQRKELKQ